jgi:flagellar motor switch protein FliN/FliY
VEVCDAELPKASSAPSASPAGQINLLLEMSMPVSVSMGQMEMKIRDLLQVGPGSVLKLDKHVGEPVELYLNGVKFALADLVVVGERIGVRVREVLGGAEAITGG